VSEKKDSKDMVYIEDFFIVYVKGLQGFVEKLDILHMADLEREELYTYVLGKTSEVKKIKLNLDN
jgi:hypothetical protein